MKRGHDARGRLLAPQAPWDERRSLSRDRRSLHVGTHVVLALAETDWLVLVLDDSPTESRTVLPTNTLPKVGRQPEALVSAAIQSARASGGMLAEMIGRGSWLDNGRSPCRHTAHCASLPPLRRSVDGLGAARYRHPASARAAAVGVVRHGGRRLVLARAACDLSTDRPDRPCRVAGLRRHLAGGGARRTGPAATRVPQDLARLGADRRGSGHRTGPPRPAPVLPSYSAPSGLKPARSRA